MSIDPERSQSFISSKPIIRMGAWIALAFLYLVIRFGLTVQLDSFGEYASYFFETALVLIAIVLTGKSFFEMFAVRRSVLFGAFGTSIAGFAIYKLATTVGILIPFDLQGKETILMLLLVAPILEEFIFRFFLWQPIDSLIKRPVFTWSITSLIFSYSHLHTIWFVPAEIHPFIILQTIYTLALGFACGYFVFRQKSILGAILLHFFFNLGFYLASLNS
ncbi:MAG: CPBP family intramembrane metalloprotease [Bdellovibrionales bacterium]|nr:CPBP family intramembrane metalloprotease [Bdellovibrionales bacterium]